MRPLIGSDGQGRPVCGPCAGAPGLDYTCRECGRGGEIHSGRRCFGCVLAERARILLADPGGDVSAQLHPLLDALSTVTNPATVVSWLSTSRSASGSLTAPPPAGPYVTFFSGHAAAAWLAI
ncbi:MAG TPA: hypothetical protein VMH35_03495 [Streptosporangiaceae bacterium]|nr:hypothetical protein [Streptosporangiaceae bacterium]